MWYNRGNIWFWQFSKLLKIGGGAHYNWNTATLTSSKTAMDSTDKIAGSSICPKNWGLPGITDTGKSWQNLFSGSNYNIPNSTDGFKTLTVFPLNYQPMGRFFDDQVSSEDTLAYWWANTTYDTKNAYYLNVNRSLINPKHYGNRGYGNAVRCVAK